MPHYLHIDSPIGLIQIESVASGIRSVSFVEKRQEQDETQPPAHLRDCATQLKAYFNGTLTKFNCKLAMEGTDFQKSTWNALLQVGFGQTRTYMDIASAIRNKKAIRAVGAANGQNRIAIIVPCHRIIGSDGSLTGYASGLERKKWLLDFERKSYQASLF